MVTYDREMYICGIPVDLHFVSFFFGHAISALKPVYLHNIQQRLSRWTAKNHEKVAYTTWPVEKREILNQEISDCIGSEIFSLWLD